MASVFKRKRDRTRKNSSWYIAYVDENGVRRSVKGCPDKQATQQIAARLESEAELRRRGIIDTKSDAYAAHEAVLLLDHLDAFKASVAAKGGSKRHPEVTHSRARKMLELAGAKRISELSQSKAMSAVAALREEGLSTETINHHIRAVKAFSRWLWRDGRAGDHHLAHISTSSPAGDRRHNRRALTPTEAISVIQFAESGPEVGGLIGPDRAILYDLALGTGLRAKELRTLTPNRFSLGSNPPTVTVMACYDKRRKEAVQPLAPALANRLRSWLAGKAPGKLVFDGMTTRTAEMFKTDLEAAGIPYDTESGIADFHSLRAAYITNLVATGASVKTCQTLARHSTPSLTIGIYAKASIHDIRGAVESLPDLSRPDVKTAALRTGTDDLRVSGLDSALTALGQRAWDAPRLSLADTDVIAGSIGPLATSVESLQNRGSDASCRLQSITGGENRTLTGVTAQRILSPQHEPSRFILDNDLRQSDVVPTAQGQRADSNDPDLALISQAWHTLPEALRAGIVAMVKAARAK